MRVPCAYLVRTLPGWRTSTVPSTVRAALSETKSAHQLYARTHERTLQHSPATCDAQNCDVRREACNLAVDLAERGRELVVQLQRGVALLG